MLKALGIAFSARKVGNCSRCVEYCLQKLEERRFRTRFLNAYELKITPCSHCNYECFAKPREKCPIEDDVKMMFDEIFQADIILFGIPNYGTHPSGLYRAWFERGCMLNWEDVEKVVLPKAKGYIVVSSLAATGGDQVLHEILTEFYNTSYRPEAILLQTIEYERDSLKGDLTEVPEVKRRLDRLVERVLGNVGK